MGDILSGETLLRRIERATGILLAVLIVGAWAFFSGRAALGVLLGGGITILSFQALKWQLKRAFQTPGKVPRKAGLFASYYLRFLATLFLVYVVMYYGWADPIAFLVGLSVVVLSIMIGGVLEYSKKGED